MEPKAELHKAYINLMQAPDRQARAQAAEELNTIASHFAATFEDADRPDAGKALERDHIALSKSGRNIGSLSDELLASFNRLLPWAAMTVDSKGRSVGNAWSSTKRTYYNALIDPRLRDFDKIWPLEGKHVLEVGCFEGIHTLAALLLGASRVTGVDGRIENILKTMARLWAYDQTTELLLWDLEKEVPNTIPEHWDMLHHIGVLYHLTNPVEHLDVVLPRTRGALMLDTHVALDDAKAKFTYTVGDQTYAYQKHIEAGIEINPFAGLSDHAKWLRTDDLIAICQRHGFKTVNLIEDRAERNGRRVLIHAFR
jgi:2-polyprenyl-3-methyl-5-hydroxy-6-metoxy-1,4-benzoquinol methylase